MMTTPEPTDEELRAALLRTHRLLDSLALYVLRYGNDPRECFGAVEQIQDNQRRFGFTITATFAPEHWKQQALAAEGDADERRRIRR